jgi:hypothetical protein
MRSRLALCLGVLAMSLGLTACGSSASSTGGDPESSPGGQQASSGPVVEIVRTGGIGGVRDTVKITSDGGARVTTKDGRSRGCEPPAKALARLRGIDLAAVAAAPTAAPRLADGFNYAVRIGDERAAAGEGDEDGRRADQVDAAAAVLTSCLQAQSGPMGY